MGIDLSKLGNAINKVGEVAGKVGEVVNKLSNTVQSVSSAVQQLQTGATSPAVELPAKIAAAATNVKAAIATNSQISTNAASPNQTPATPNTETTDSSSGGFSVDWKLGALDEKISKGAVGNS